MEMATQPEDIKIPKREKRTIVYLTPTEVEEFFDVAGMKRRGYAEINRLRNIAIVKLLYCSGLRVGELCCLNRNPIRNRQFSVVGNACERSEFEGVHPLFQKPQKNTSYR